MPDFTTHYLFGTLYMKDAFASDKKKIIDNNMQAFNWGLQGPDLLFFSKFYRDTGKTARCGSQLHQINPELIFSEIINLLIDSCNERYYNCLLSYFYGFLCHYVLDSTVHPYVYYLIYNSDSQNVKAKHLHVENNIGKMLFKRVAHSYTEKSQLCDRYLCDGNFVEPISELYVYLIKRLMGKTVSEKEIKSGFAMCLAFNKFSCKFANTKYENKAKRVFINSAKTLAMKSELLSCFIENDDDSNDVLNLQHSTWFNLNIPDNVFTYSVPDLFEQSKEKVNILADKCTYLLSKKEYSSLGLYETFDNGKPMQHKEKLKGRT